MKPKKPKRKVIHWARSFKFLALGYGTARCGASALSPFIKSRLEYVTCKNCLRAMKRGK